MIAYRLAAVSVCALGLAGCSVLPASGPTAREMVQQSATNPETGFVVVDLDDRVLNIVGRSSGEGFSGSFQNRRPSADLRVGTGDVLQISIYEAGGSGLFGPGAAAGGVAGQNAGAHSVPLQPVAVGRDGMISVPFAGRIQAAGLSPDQIRARIENALRDKAIQPQVLVTPVGNSSNVATVGGEVYKASVVPLSQRGDRLLDAIAAAGGARYPAHETYVRVTRGGRGATVLLQTIVGRPSENIFVQPGDDIYVSRIPRTFTAFGASTKVGHYPFDTDRLTLAEAVAKAGGLVDNQADPAGVFLFRHEPLRTAQALRPDLKWSGDGRVPVIYRLNLREANGYFIAQNMSMRDKDVILVANADGAQLLKFFTLLRGVSGIVSDIRSTSTVRN